MYPLRPHRFLLVTSPQFATSFLLNLDKHQMSHLMEQADDFPSSDSAGDSFSSLDPDELPSLVSFSRIGTASAHCPTVRVSSEPDGGKESSKSLTVSEGESLVTCSDHGQASERPVQRLSVGSRQPSEELAYSSSSSNMLGEGDHVFYFPTEAGIPHAPPVPTLEHSDSAASRDSMYLFDNNLPPVPRNSEVDAERRSSSSIDRDLIDNTLTEDGNQKTVQNEQIVELEVDFETPVKDLEVDYVKPVKVETTEKPPRKDNFHRSSHRTKRHDRSLRRQDINGKQEEEGTQSHKRKSRSSSERHHRHPRDKTSDDRAEDRASAQSSERKKERSKDKTASLRRKKKESVAGVKVVRSEVSMSGKEEDKIKKKEEKPPARGHHPSLKRRGEGGSRSTRRLIKDNTDPRHQRTYLTAEELTSQSNTSLLSVALQEGKYDEQLGSKRPKHRPKKQEDPPDHPYRHYDSVSEKHLRKERKRLKHPKVTGFQLKVGDLVTGPPELSRPSTALVLRSESRRESSGSVSRVPPH